MGDPDPVFHLPGLFWLIRITDNQFQQGGTGNAGNDQWVLDIKNLLEFDRFQIMGPGNVRTRLNLHTTYTKLPGPAQHVTPNGDPTGPNNWAGDVWGMDAKTTFSFAYEDGSFSVKGSADNANSVEGVIPGHYIHEQNGVFAR